MRRLVAALMVVSLLAGSVIFTAYAEKESRETSSNKENVGWTAARLVVGTGVDNREPQGVAESFPASTEKVICFLDAKNIAEDTTVTFVWMLGTKEILKTDLPLKKGPQWRTRADKKINGQKGDWKIEVRDAAGKVVKDVQFKVE
ncbi:MAG: DUF2914 domain-containing protein [Deltaproteobacteria bacterium]|nr:DUF2914 domain-containing protein [Deltaproteobacteria bacterium]